jgi:hypothetical protein
MADPNHTTDEKLASKTKTEIVKEAKRIEEALLYSSKGHFVSARFWSNFHLFIGIPIVVISGIAGASAFSTLDSSHIVAGVLSLLVAGLSAIATFLNPNERASAHMSSGNSYDALMNKVRIFWAIDCWRDESEEVLTERLKWLSEQKDELNRKCGQIPGWAYTKAKKGIEAGEASFKVDA